MATVTTDIEEGRRVGQDTPPAPGRRFGFGLVANTLLGYTLAKGLQLTLYNLIFPLYAYSLGYDQETIGRLNATGALMVLICSVPLGMLADRIGRARLLTISAFLSPLTLLGIALSSSLPALVVWLLAQNAVEPAADWGGLGGTAGPRLLDQLLLPVGGRGVRERARRLRDRRGGARPRRGTE